VPDNEPSAYYDPPTGKSNAEWLQDFQSNDQHLSDVLGINPVEQFISSRLPGKNAWRVGSISVDAGNSSRVANHISGNGYKIYGWNTEWARENGVPSETPETVANRVRNLILTPPAGYKDGKVIVLMHDTMFREKSGHKQDLCDFIDKLQSFGMGIVFRTVQDY